MARHGTRRRVAAGEVELVATSQVFKSSRVGRINVESSASNTVESPVSDAEESSSSSSSPDNDEEEYQPTPQAPPQQLEVLPPSSEEEEPTPTQGGQYQGGFTAFTQRQEGAPQPADAADDDAADDDAADDDAADDDAADEDPWILPTPSPQSERGDVEEEQEETGTGGRFLVDLEDDDDAPPPPLLEHNTEEEDDDGGGKPAAKSPVSFGSGRNTNKGRRNTNNGRHNKENYNYSILQHNDTNKGRGSKDTSAASILLDNGGGKPSAGSNTNTNQAAAGSGGGGDDDPTQSPPKRKVPTAHGFVYTSLSEEEVADVRGRHNFISQRSFEEDGDNDKVPSLGTVLTQRSFAAASNLLNLAGKESVQPPPPPAGRKEVVNPYQKKKSQPQQLAAQLPQQPPAPQQADPVPPPQQQQVAAAQLPPPQQQFPAAASLPAPGAGGAALNNIYRLIKQTGLEGASPEDQQRIKKCKTGKASSGHYATQDALENRFFKTLEDYGGEGMSQLAAWVPSIKDPNVMERAFYSLIGGPKDELKQPTLNDCLVLILSKWRITTPPSKVGKHYQSSAFKKMIQNLFGVFKRKGILYTWYEDFNSKGDFCGQVKDLWDEIRKTDPKFGTGQNKAHVDFDLDRKLRVAIKMGWLKPYEDPLHLILCVLHIHGRYCAFRGEKEHHNLQHDHVHRGTHQEGECDPEMEGLAYYGVKIDEDKCNKLSLSNPTTAPEDTHLLTYVENPKDELFDPVYIMDLYLSKCHDDAHFFLAKPYIDDEQRQKWKNQCNGRDVWFGPARRGSTAYKCGEHWIKDCFKLLARICKVSGDWEKHTGHAWRSIAISIAIMKGLPAVDTAKLARHRSVESQKAYARECKKRLANRQKAMIADTLEEDDNEELPDDASPPPPKKYGNSLKRRLQAPSPSGNIRSGSSSKAKTKKTLTNRKTVGQASDTVGQASDAVGQASETVETPNAKIRRLESEIAAMRQQQQQQQQQPPQQQPPAMQAQPPMVGNAPMMGPPPPFPPPPPPQYQQQPQQHHMYNPVQGGFAPQPIANNMMNEYQLFQQFHRYQQWQQQQLQFQQWQTGYNNGMQGNQGYNFQNQNTNQNGGWNQNNGLFPPNNQG